MFDVQDLATGELVLELGCHDEVKAFLNEVDFSFNYNANHMEFGEVKSVLRNYGFQVYQID